MKHFANIQKKHHQKIFLENIHNFTIKADKIFFYIEQRRAYGMIMIRYC